MAKTLAPAQVNEVASTLAIRPYLTVDELTGEERNKYKYLEGHPRQYRFDAKEGVFTINGNEKVGRTMTIQPIAWRIFSDNILNMGTKNWAELFFIDAKNCVSGILFHGYSVDNIFRLIEPLYYDDQTLADVVLTVVAERKENTKIQPKGIYHIATFSYVLGEPEKTAELKAYAQDFKIFRQETLTDIAHIKTAHAYFNPFTHAEGADLLLASADLTQRDINNAVEQEYQNEAV